MHVLGERRVLGAKDKVEEKEEAGPARAPAPAQWNELN
jgi:hypothetical protein